MDDAHPQDPDDAPARADSLGLEQLFGALYTELRRSARRAMGPQQGQVTIQPTALVHEAYMRLLKADQGQFNDRRHFLLAASKAMRHVLIEAHRRRTSSTRPQGRADLDVDRLMVPFEERAVDLEGLEAALVRLEEESPQDARIVELRFFGGVSMAEIGGILEIPDRTLYRRWQAIRLWLHGRLS